MLVDDLHYIASVLVCPDCAQRFLSTLSETVDWVGGDDAQFWTLLPITDAEAAALAAHGASVTEAHVAAVGPGRRALRRDYPTGGAPRVYWDSGT